MSVYIHILMGNGACVPNQPLCANATDELRGATCYPQCQAGYTGSVTQCTQNCPAGMTDLGASCAKDSYSRGAGTTPVARCAAGEDLYGGLCYSQSCASDPDSDGTRTAAITCKCKPGQCWPLGIKTDLKFGKSRPADYGCGPNQENIAGLCYDKCQGGYTGQVTQCVKAGCPDGMADTGVGCMKNSYSRGVGVPPSGFTVCPSAPAPSTTATVTVATPAPATGSPTTPLPYTTDGNVMCDTTGVIWNISQLQKHKYAAGAYAALGSPAFQHDNAACQRLGVTPTGSDIAAPLPIPTIPAIPTPAIPALVPQPLPTPTVLPATGLSSGAKIAIGVSVGVAVVAIGSVTIWAATRHVPRARRY